MRVKPWLAFFLGWQPQDHSSHSSPFLLKTPSPPIHLALLCIHNLHSLHIHTLLLPHFLLSHRLFRVVGLRLLHGPLASPALAYHFDRLHPFLMQTRAARLLFSPNLLQFQNSRMMMLCLVTRLQLKSASLYGAHFPAYGAVAARGTHIQRCLCVPPTACA